MLASNPDMLNDAVVDIEFRTDVYKRQPSAAVLVQLPAVGLRDAAVRQHPDQAVDAVSYTHLVVNDGDVIEFLFNV